MLDSDIAVLFDTTRIRRGNSVEVSEDGLSITVVYGHEWTVCYRKRICHWGVVVDVFAWDAELESKPEDKLCLVCNLGDSDEVRNFWSDVLELRHSKTVKNRREKAKEILRFINTL